MGRQDNAQRTSGHPVSLSARVCESGRGSCRRPRGPARLGYAEGVRLYADEDEHGDDDRGRGPRSHSRQDGAGGLLGRPLSPRPCAPGRPLQGSFPRYSPFDPTLLRSGVATRGSLSRPGNFGRPVPRVLTGGPTSRVTHPYRGRVPKGGSLPPPS